MDELHRIAKEIAKDGFSWWKDRQLIMELVEKADDFVQAQGVSGEQNREDAVYYLFSFFDTIYGWDAPNMDEDTERMFYRYLIQWKIK